VFFSLDLICGFRKISLHPSSKCTTTFQFEGELYQVTVMPFGVFNGQSSFQRLMNEVPKDCESFAVAYLDGIVIFSEDAQSHFHYLSCVLRALIKAGLKANVAKCKFMASEITFLGHKVS
jgi:hypothetical protein